ncbi:MAG TPA: SDR family oxidoreductase [Spirochaetia bacterium]|nr:SDR family oxidoreductase [Spirochaetia bacterium]
MAESDSRWTISGKRALVTGAAKRLGRDITLALARAGTHVVLHYHSSKTEANKLADECRALGVQAHTVSADLSDSVAAAGLVAQATTQAGPLDILINNASVFPSSTLHDLTEEKLCDNVRVNALAPFLLTRAFATQTEDGVVINLLDTRITEYDRNHAAYHASKRMLATLTRMTALEFAPQIRVNGIAPGLILPPEGKDESYLAALTDTVPLGRHGSPEDIARTVLFLAGSAFITGEIIFVDGGRRMKGDMYGF